MSAIATPNIHCIGRGISLFFIHDLSPIRRMKPVIDIVSEPKGQTYIDLLNFAAS